MEKVVQQFSEQSAFKSYRVDSRDGKYINITIKFAFNSIERLSLADVRRPYLFGIFCIIKLQFVFIRAFRTI